MRDNIGGQFLQGLEVVPQRLFDEMALLHPRCADVPLEQLAGRAGDDRRDLRFAFHVYQ